MSADDPTLPVYNETFAALQTLLLTVDDVDTFLTDLARLATSMARAISCGITTGYDGRPLTVASSDAQAMQLDEVQYALGDGPCLQAMRTGSAVHVTDLDSEQRWPSYIAHARAQGLAESLSLPLIVGGTSIGAVNLYSFHPGGVFTGAVRTGADLFVAQASTALLLAVRQLEQSAQNRNLERALNSRSTIDQAIGMLMAQQGCSADEAFDLLRRHSQNNNRRLRDVAAELVQRRSED